MGAPVAAWGRGENNDRFPCSLILQEGSWFFIWGEGRGGPTRWVGEVAEVFAHSFGGGVCRFHAFDLTPAFAPDS